LPELCEERIAEVIATDPQRRRGTRAWRCREKHRSSIGIVVIFRLPHASKGKKRVGLLSRSDNHASPQHCPRDQPGRVREFYIHGTEVRVQGRDANLVYVWAVPGEDGVIKLSKNAIRTESSDVGQQPSADSKPRTVRIRRTMSSSKQSINAQSSIRGDTNGKSDTAGIAALIEQAETVKTSLSTAFTETKQLVAALKKHRQQSKALKSTLASLRQLQSVDL